jgi:hypothetical protein
LITPTTSFGIDVLYITEYVVIPVIGSVSIFGELISTGEE